ncbi:MAG: hypothetical protein OXJ64_13845, partial [Boseongicola sp.]|nr:hypothetical protein [Boseongicola sp.]
MDFVAWGEDTVRLVLAVSELLRERYSPGVVSLGLVLLLLLACSLFGRQTWRRCAALRKFRGVVRQHARNPAEFYAGRAEVTREMEADAERRGPKSSVSLAWREYSETFVEHPEEHGTVLRNSVRPSLFFNLDDLHFGPGFWRVMPGLFVTVGLFLTFLGLISALGAMQDEGAASEEAMTNLLGVASAKFIMSLTGLLCSTTWVGRPGWSGARASRTASRRSESLRRSGTISAPVWRGSRNAGPQGSRGSSTPTNRVSARRSRP